MISPKLVKGGGSGAIGCVTIRRDRAFPQGLKKKRGGHALKTNQKGHQDFWSSNGRKQKKGGRGREK